MTLDVVKILGYLDRFGIQYHNKVVPNEHINTDEDNLKFIDNYVTCKYCGDSTVLLCPEKNGYIATCYDEKCMKITAMASKERARQLYFANLRKMYDQS